MWMQQQQQQQQKKKYDGEGARDVPRQAYPAENLDNEMTFKRDAEGDDFRAPYRPLGM